MAPAILILVAACAALVGGGFAALPPAAGRSLRDRTALARSKPGLTVAGAFHVHSIGPTARNRSTTSRLRRKRGGLEFLVFTDHGDGTAAARAAYRHGVLTIEGVEISTMNGHQAAVGMAPSPYPPAGEARDVVEDVARLGGVGVVAHYWFRPAETLGTLLSPSSELANRFDRITAMRPLIFAASVEGAQLGATQAAGCPQDATSSSRRARPGPIAPAATTTDALGDLRAFVPGNDASSSVALEPVSDRPGAVVFRYGLGGGPASHQQAKSSSTGSPSSDTLSR